MFVEHCPFVGGKTTLLNRKFTPLSLITGFGGLRSQKQTGFGNSKQNSSVKAYQ
jgi:hypothetical protein